jgi:hypothetical protein
VPGKPNTCSPCCDSCTIFSDTFASDDLSANWTNVSGTFAIASGTLNCTSASAAEVTNAASGAGATGIYVSADITCATTSDKGRLITAYTDSNNYWFCEVQPGATNGTLKLFQRSAGVDTQRGSTQTLTGFHATDVIHVFLCVGGGFVRVMAYETTSAMFFISFSSSPTITSKQAGCGTGSGSSDVKFDNFLFSKSGFEDSHCHDCFPCCNLSAPVSLQVVIAGISNESSSDCASANGTWTLPFIEYFNNICEWRLQLPVTCGDGYFLRVFKGDIGAGGGMTVVLARFFSITGTYQTQISWNSSGHSDDCSTWVAESIPWALDFGSDCCTSDHTAALVTSL